VKLLVLSVGTPERGPATTLVEDYASRIRRFGITVDLRWVKEVKPSSRFTEAHRRERDARALGEALPRGARTIAPAAAAENTA